MARNPDRWPVEISTVKTIEMYDDGGFAITQESGWSFFVNAEEANKFSETPEPGDNVVVLGGLGHEIRGIFINDREYRYVTREEAEKRREEWLASHAREKEERFYANIGDYIKRKEALDKPFRERLNRFANKGFKKFWTEDGGYELFAVEQADQLLKHVKERCIHVDQTPVEWLDWFYKLDWDEQMAAFPGLDDGHSGNTFGAMVGLAKAVARGDSI